MPVQNVSFRSIPHVARLTLLLLGTLLALLPVASTSASHHGPTGLAQASDDDTPPPSFVIRPADQPDGSYVTMTVAPGERGTAAVVFGNGGEQDSAAFIFAADAFTLVNGGFGAAPAGSDRSGPTTWLDFDDETLTLAAGRGVERTIAVEVPAGTAPGEYLLAMVIQNAEPIAVSGSAVFDQTLRRAMAVLVIVPGPLAPAAAIGRVAIDQSASPARLIVEVRNTGNQRLNLSGDALLTDPDGNPALDGPATISVIYAGDTTTLDLPIGRPIIDGTYDLTLTLADEIRGVTVGTGTEPVAVEATGAGTPVPAAPITLTDVAVDPQPDTGSIQYVDVTATIANTGAPVRSARLTLDVTRDGELVERFPLATSLAVESGDTEIQQRYLPMTGWESGTWAFVLSLDALDPAGNSVQLLAEVPVEATIIIP